VQDLEALKQTLIQEYLSFSIFVFRAFLKQIHDINSIEGTDILLRYLYHSTTLDIPTCFDPPETIIREPNQRNIA
jgi:hypothetical protein